jgi:ferredoxin-nitrite reductase
MPEQMRALAEVAREHGDGDIRLTVWQNLLISGVPTAQVERVVAVVEALGLSTQANAIRAGLIACTGNAGCRLALSNTKRHAQEIAEWCEARVELDSAVNIHLTGCPNSCAQHYVGDIGLVGARVQVSDDGDTVDGYHIHVGGGFGPDAGIAREVYRDVKGEEAPRIVERMLKAYVAHRADKDEPFFAFTRRHELETLKAMFEENA